MAFTRFPDPTNNISNLANQPVEPPATLKQKFDQIGEDLKDWNNNTFLPELESIANGDSGADNIGATPVGAGVATTVQGIVEELDAKIDTQLPTPDGSITDVKLSNSPSALKQRFANLNTVNVKDYGAVGDGVTNDTTSITNAINYLNSVGGGTLIFPSTQNYYSINSTLPIYSKINIIGQGAQPTRIKNTNALGADCFKNNTGARVQSCSFSNMQIEGNANSGNGLNLFNVAYSNFTNLLINSHGKNGIYVNSIDGAKGSYYNKFYSVDCTDNLFNGILFEDHANENTVFGGRMQSNTLCGVEISEVVYALNNVNLYSVACENNLSYGIKVNAKDLKIDGCRLENNTTAGVKITTKGKRVVLIGNFYATQAIRIESDLVDGFTDSPNIIDPSNTNGIDFNNVYNLGGTNLQITGIKGISGTTTKSNNFFIKNIAVTQGVTSMTFTLPVEEEDNQYQVVGVLPNWFTTVARGTITKTTFNLQFGTVAPALAAISCILVR